MIRRPPRSTLFPYTTLFRSERFGVVDLGSRNGTSLNGRPVLSASELQDGDRVTVGDVDLQFRLVGDAALPPAPRQPVDRKSTRLNSSHANISYAVFCLKKKK